MLLLHAGERARSDRSEEFSRSKRSSAWCELRGLGVDKIRLTGGEPLVRKDLPV